jgi:hypothetical protein
VALFSLGKYYIQFSFHSITFHDQSLDSFLLVFSDL